MTRRGTLCCVRAAQVFLVVVCLLCARRAMADFFRVSPGPLDESHAEFDHSEGCQQCHESGEGVTRERCLACHKTLREHIAQRKGLHATVSDSCVSCHPQHKGRDFNITDWRKAGGRDSFNHDVTKFSLKHHHANTACTACHVRRLKSGRVSYLGLSPECQSCHKGVHGFSRPDFTKQCDSCHQSGQTLRGRRLVDWNAQHEQVAKMALLGKHQELACTACHPKAIMAGRASPRTCADCHTSHHPKVPEMAVCSRCHQSGNPWNAVKLDHGKYGFALLGRHRSVPCAKCHLPSFGTRRLTYTEGACANCHQHRNVHKNQFADKPCASCHVEGGKRSRPFDHDWDSKFPFTGFHADAGVRTKCASCHPDEIYRNGKHRCQDCHKDKHAGQLGDDCTKCHSTTKHFREAKFANYAHDKFPLEGVHRTVACAKCHPNERYKLGKLTCVDCHEKTDPHHGKLGRNCEKCHIPDKGAPKFRHETMTQFRRTGMHERVACTFCHRARPTPLPVVGWTRGQPTPPADRRFPVMGTRCVECHADPHKGEAGQACESCHNTSSFKTLIGGAPASLMPKPSDHTSAWIRTHANLPEGDRDREGQHGTCTPCHAAPACTQCHRTRTPKSHTGLWRIKTHGTAAAFDSSSCRVCHSPGACIHCHRRTPPLNHRGAWGRRHGLAAGTLGSEQCAVCHQRGDCAACHSGR